MFDFVRQLRWKRIIEVGVLLAFITPLVLYAWVGIYTRLAADDYETAGAMQKYGFWESQVFWRESWSGRYSYVFLVNVFYLFGVPAAPVLTFLFLGLWLLCFSSLLVQIFRNENLAQQKYFSVLGAAVIITITLRSMDHIHQILFWVTGVFTYLNNIILMLIGLIYFVYRYRCPISWKNRWWEFLLFGLYAFFSAGISETGSVLQIVICSVGVLLFLLLRPKPRGDGGISLIGVALVASVAGFIFVVAAPGNAFRIANRPPTPDLISLIVYSNLYTIEFIAGWIWRETVLAGIAFLAPLLMGFIDSQSNRKNIKSTNRDDKIFKTLLVSIPVMYILLLSQIAVGYYALSRILPDRALLIPQFILVTMFALWGYLTGKMLRGLLRENTQFPKVLIFIGIVLMILIISLGPGYASIRIFTMVAPARERAIDWDRRDRVIRQEIEAGNRDVVVWYIQDFNRLGDYTSDPNFSVNQAAADYYGVDSITALDPPPHE